MSSWHFGISEIAFTLGRTKTTIFHDKTIKILQTEQEDIGIPEDWWKLPSQRLIRHYDHDALQFFIVVNRALALNELMGLPLYRNEFDRHCWDYEQLMSTDCSGSLDESR